MSMRGKANGHCEMSGYKVLIVSTEQDQRDELLEYAWGIIANAYGGDWDLATVQWKSAAEKWRDIWIDLCGYEQNVEGKLRN